MRNLVILGLGVALMLVSSNVSAQESPEGLTADHPNLPNGYTLAAYLNCGAETESAGNQGIHIEQVMGGRDTFANLEGPLSTVAADKERVQFEVTGLNPDSEYVLGYTWWDADGARRAQYVQASPTAEGEQTLLFPKGPALAYHANKPTWARILLPLDPALIEDGVTYVSFLANPGPNAVVQELWVCEKTDATERKRVLIVTGDDYVGHLWRETGPEFAEILREDPRLEVSITESPAILASPVLDHYDAVLIHFKDYPEHLWLPKDAHFNPVEYVKKRDKGLVVAHFGCGAFEGMAHFGNLIGRVWNPEFRGHDPYGNYQVNIVDKDHPITASMDGSFRTDGELYTCLDGDTPIRTLCEARSKVDKKDYPIGFVVPHPAGRVFHCTIGHDVNALQSDGSRTLYRRAVAWAAGLSPDH